MKNIYTYIIEKILIGKNTKVGPTEKNIEEAISIITLFLNSETYLKSEDQYQIKVDGFEVKVTIPGENRYNFFRNIGNHIDERLGALCREHFALNTDKNLIIFYIE